MCRWSSVIPDTQSPEMSVICIYIYIYIYILYIHIYIYIYTYYTYIHIHIYMQSSIPFGFHFNGFLATHDTDVKLRIDRTNECSINTLLPGQL